MLNTSTDSGGSVPEGSSRPDQRTVSGIGYLSNTSGNLHLPLDRRRLVVGIESDLCS